MTGHSDPIADALYAATCANTPLRTGYTAASTPSDRQIERSRRLILSFLREVDPEQTVATLLQEVRDLTC